MKKFALHSPHALADWLKGTMLLLALSHPTVGGTAWEVTPSLDLQALYTDNVDLLPKPLTQEEWITEVAPLVTIDNKSVTDPIIGLYRVQGIFYGNDSRAHRIFQQALFNAQKTLYKNQLKLQLVGDHTQQVVFPDGTISFDNLRGGNQTNVSRVDVGPDLTFKLFNQLQSFLKYRYGHVFYHDSNIADANSHQTSWSLQSTGTSKLDFRSQLQWRQTRQAGQRISEVFEILGTLGYQLSSKIRPYVTFGYEENQGQATQAGIDGLLWRIGAQYVPSKRLILDANFGQRAFGNSYYLRASWAKRYQTLTLAYEEQITNFFEDQLQALSGARLQAFGTASLQFQPQFRQDLFVKKEVTFNWFIQGSKTYLDLSPYYERRISQSGFGTEKGYGLNSTLGFKRSSKLDFSILGGFNHQSFINQLTDKRFQVGVRANQQLSPGLQLIYRLNHFEVDRKLFSTIRENSASISLYYTVS